MLLSAIGMLTSCDDFLDETPDNRAELNTKEKITKILVSAYPNANHFLLTEFASDNTDEVDNFTSTYPIEQEAYLWKDVTYIDEDTPFFIWDACYKAIAAANQAIKAIEEMGSPEELNPQMGEALMCRAYNHFLLVNLFCMHYTESHGETDLGIPYMEKPETSVSPKYDRSNVAAVYEKINADIEKGLPLINDDIYSVPSYHFNRKAAYAFAARFNLFYLKYDKVIEYATQVLTENPASVLRDWETEGAIGDNGTLKGDAYISANNKATLLAISAYSLWGRVSGPYSISCRYSHNGVIAEKESCKAGGTLDSSLSPWGVYSNMYYTIPSYPQIPKIIMRKISEYFEYIDIVNGIGNAHIVGVHFTTDETLLCRAEAYTMLNQFDKAAEDLRIWQDAFTKTKGLTREKIVSTYEKMKYYSYTSPTPKKRLNPDFAITSTEQECFIHCILFMRRVQGLHEGHRWFDIKRYGIEIARRIVLDKSVLEVTDEMLVDDPRRAFQIPQEVISAGMTPNPRNK